MSGIEGLRDKVGRGWHVPRPDRRTLLIGGGAAAGLALAWAVWPRDPTVAVPMMPGENGFGAYLKIANDGRVTVLVPQAETGEGDYTLIAHIAADELGADWRTIAVEPAPIAPAYANTLLLAEDAALATPRLGVPDILVQEGGWRRSILAGTVPAILSGGSTTQRMFEAPVRECAAVARALLCMAAARRWDIAWEECEAQGGFVIHQQQRLRFGELAAAAAELDPPSTPPLRATGSGPLFGEDLPRLDLPAKIDGSLNFAGDIRLPGLVHAAIRQGPIGDTRLKRYDLAAAGRITGFLTAVRHERWVAAVATNSWAAQRALDAMDPTFTSSGQRADSAAIDRRLKAAVDAFDGTRMAETGDVADAFAGRPVFGADYLIAPALHQPLETRTATAAPEGGRIRLWVATQAPGFCRAAVAAALDVPEAQISLFVMPGGGSFGIAMEHEVAVQAALLARALDRPVQLVWTRTEEILRDLPRAPARARVRGSLSAGATIDALHIAIAAPAARHEWRARLTGSKPHDAMRASAGRADAAAVAGAVPPYRIPNLAVDHLPVDTALPAGRWCGQAESHTVFVVESFVDELARLSGVEPFSFRMGMLGSAPELARCLQSATALGGWDGGAAGSGHGIACCSLRGSHIAVMAVARPGSAGLIVERLVAAVDVGRVLNPGLVRQRIESGLMFGLAAAVGATTRYRRGLAGARRLAEIGLPDLSRSPQVEIEILESERDPGGVEELAVPPVAPALANALYTVTSLRIRRLPLSTKALP